MGVVACLTFTVVDPKAQALSVMMQALRTLGRERTDHDGNLVVCTSLPDGEPPDRLASDDEIERDFARGEPFIMIFNRPGEYFAMDSITFSAKRENGVSKIGLSTREAKYDTYDPGPMFAETMRAFSYHFLKFTVEYEAS